MESIKDLHDLASELTDDTSFNPNADFEKVRDVVDALVELGNTPEIFTFHDDHLGLEDQLSDDFLNTPLNELDEKKFESEIDTVLEQANIIKKLSERELSDEDLEEIEEDKRYRGEISDD